MAYLDPKNDLTFKKVFGEHPDLLKSLLNALLPLEEGRHVERLEYLPTEMVPVIPELKNTIVDVRCYDNFGRHFIVEMQMFWTDSFKYRVLFNASKAYVKQLGKGKKFESLQPVYALSLVNENFQSDLTKFYHHYRIIHTQDSNQQIEGLEFVFIELPNFKPANYAEKKMMVLWLRFLTEIEDGTRTAPKDLLENEDTRKALEILQESAFSQDELDYYDRYWDIISTERTYAHEIEQKALKAGETIGIEKGMEKGMEKGIEKGMEKGTEIGIGIGEKNNSVNTALKMIAKGFDDETINELSGLSITEIQTLRRTGTLD